MLSTEKKELLSKIIPKATLKALTESSRHTIIKRVFREDIIPIFSYPFRIGREARVEYIEGEVVFQERHKLGGHEPNNDAYLLDNGKYLQISREHCSIIKQGDKYLLQDRGSACGSMVNELYIGGDDHDGSTPLADGDIITLGSKESQYKYKFILFDLEDQENL